MTQLCFFLTCYMWPILNLICPAHDLHCLQSLGRNRGISVKRVVGKGGNYRCTFYEIDGYIKVRTRSIFGYAY